MIVQGTNVPISLVFNEDIENGATKLEAGLYKDGKELKHWSKADVKLDDCTASLPLTEAETLGFPSGIAVLEVKWLENNLTNFAEQMPIEIGARSDKTRMVGA